MMPRAACYESAIVVSRQNGKGSVIEICELAWLFLLGARTILHTAHEFPTAREGFQRIEALIAGTPELKAEVARGGIKWSHGDESITLKSGQRLLFKTRTKGAARGFTIDKLIMDEAMVLKADQVSALQPATSARPDPQILLTGSAGNKESEHFGRARSRGIAGSDPRLFFAEWSIDYCNDFCPTPCDEHDRADTPESYAKSNPGLGRRIQIENIESERRGMAPEVFLRERLSVGDWPVEGNAWAVIDEESWKARHEVMSAPQFPYVFAVDVSPDVAHACIVAGGFNGETIDGVKQIHVEVTQNGARYDHRSGRGWVVDRLKDLCKTHKPRYVVIDKAYQAGPIYDELVDPLKKLGVEIICPTMREYAQACGLFYSAVVPRRENAPYLVHLDQPMLTAAVAGAEKRDIQDAWAWDKRNASADITPLVAATHALWGVHKMDTQKTKPKPMAAWA